MAKKNQHRNKGVGGIYKNGLSRTVTKTLKLWEFIIINTKTFVFISVSNRPPSAGF